MVLSVGGFLGIGAKSVAVPFAQIDIRQTEDGLTYVADLTRDALDEAPSYQRHMSDDGAPPPPSVAGFLATPGPAQFTLEDLLGRPVRNMNDETLGSVAI